LDDFAMVENGQDRVERLARIAAIGLDMGGERGLVCCGAPGAVL